MSLSVERAGGQKEMGEGCRGVSSDQASSFPGQAFPRCCGCNKLVCKCGRPEAVGPSTGSPMACVSPLLPHAPSPAQVLSKQLAEK